MHRRSAPAYSGRPANARRERIKSNGKNRFRASRPSSPGRGLPVGVPRAHPGSRISPPDRAGTLRRIVPDQLVIECVSGHSRPRVRSPVRTGVPPWPRGRRTCGDLPHEARCRRPEGRCVRADAPLPEHRTGKRVACVGAGPASLTVARDLALIAIGQENTFPWIERDSGLEFDKWGLPRAGRKDPAIDAARRVLRRRFRAGAKEHHHRSGAGPRSGYLDRPVPERQGHGRPPGGQYPLRQPEDGHPRMGL